MNRRDLFGAAVGLMVAPGPVDRVALWFDGRGYLTVSFPVKHSMSLLASSLAIWLDGRHDFTKIYPETGRSRRSAQ